MRSGSKTTSGIKQVGAVALLVSLLSFRSPVLSAEDARPTLNVGDVSSLVQLTNSPSNPGLALSPDGKRVAYVTQTVTANAEINDTRDEEPREVLWVQHVDGSDRIAVGSPQEQSWGPSWSPDGKRLAFFTGSRSAERLAFWEAETGKVWMSDLPVAAGNSDARWLRDGQHVLVLSESEPRVGSLLDSPATQTPVPPIVVYSTAPTNGGRVGGESVVSSTPDHFVDLVVWNVVTRTSEYVARSIAISSSVLSPDKTKLAYTSNKGSVNADINNRQLFDVHVMDLQRRTDATVARNILTNFSGNSLTWSRDSTLLAFVGGLLRVEDAPPLVNHGAAFPGSCFIVDTRKPGEVRRVSDRTLERSQRMLWSEDDSKIFAVTEDYAALAMISLRTGSIAHTIHITKASVEDGAPGPFLESGQKVVLLLKTDLGDTEIARLDEDVPLLRIVSQTRQGIKPWSLSFSADGRVVAFIGETAARPPDVWITSDSFSPTRQLTVLNPQIEKYDLRGTETVTWRLKSGRDLQGAVLLPAGYRVGHEYPTIVWLYPGGRTGTANKDTFGFVGYSYLNLQILASHGYAVFVPNSELRIGTPMLDIANSVQPGVDEIVKMGIANPSRLGLYGQSYGGYGVFSMIVQTKRYRAAVATSGIVDLFSEYSTLYPGGGDWTAWAAENEQGKKWVAPHGSTNDDISENYSVFFISRPGRYTGSSRIRCG